VAASDPVRRSQNSRIAALDRWSREDPAVNAERGQAGLIARFEREAREADPGASDAEISRRAECARKAHMSRLGRASGVARKAGAGNGS
jgi:predicted phage gp36 major capsid-like protein